MSKLHRRTVIALTLTLIASLVLAVLAYELTLATWSGSASITQAHSTTPPVMITPTEGTRCVNGCGLYSGYDIAVAHILTLITDVQTALRYHVPFFYFSGKDFVQQGSFWPMGVLDVNGHPKPLRQDLYIGARTLTLSCSSEQVNITEQELLLAKLYSGCALPGDYVNALA